MMSWVSPVSSIKILCFENIDIKLLSKVIKEIIIIVNYNTPALFNKGESIVQRQGAFCPNGIFWIFLILSLVVSLIWTCK